MAISKTVELASGATASYHRIIGVRIRFPTAVAAMLVAPYFNEGARIAGKQPMTGPSEVTLQGAEYPFKPEQVGALHEQFSIGQNETLVEFNASFDNGQAQLILVVEKTVMGQGHQREERYQLPKSALAIDVLADLYPPLQAALFPDGERA